MAQEKLTLKSTNERIERLEKMIESFLERYGYVENSKGDINSRLYFSINFATLKSDCKNSSDFLNMVEIKSSEFTDDYGNVYVQLPPIWINLEKKHFTFENQDDNENFISLRPQAISKYKNSLIEGKIRSIANVAPNFNQVSFNKSTKFCNWVNGEQLNWLTVLYIQIMWVFAYQTKHNDDILPNENYKWNEERDCAWENTGNDIGKFLGIEQLFTSGKNFVSFEEVEENKELWKIYKQWNYHEEFDDKNRFGLWGDYDNDESSISPFFSGASHFFHYSWDCDFYSVRLCKKHL